MAGFWKPKSSTIFKEESSRDIESGAATFNFSNAPLAQQRLLLPIYKHKRQILYSVEHFGVVVIVGETGTGKSTQILQYLLENGWCENEFQVACTQPRRIAARSVAERIADEIESKIGDFVGWHIRFDKQLSSTTIVKVMTDGLLLSEINKNQFLNDYKVIIIDEDHERS